MSFWTHFVATCMISTGYDVFTCVQAVEQMNLFGYLVWTESAI